MKCQNCRNTGLATSDDFEGRLYAVPCDCPNGKPFADLLELDENAFVNAANDEWARRCGEVD